MKRRKFLKSTGFLTTAGYVFRVIPLRPHISGLEDYFIAEASITYAGGRVVLENRYTSVVFDTGKGTYSITNRITGAEVLSDVACRINEWRSDDSGFKRIWKKRQINDVFGKGLALDLTFEKERCPILFFTFILYNNRGFVTIKGGVHNTLGDAIQVKEIGVVCDAGLFRGEKVFEDFVMIDGFSGGEPLEYGTRMYSPLTRSNALKSRNNILLTFKGKNRRGIALLGGLTYSDFGKFAFIEQARRTELEKGRDGQRSLLCYLNLPFEKNDQNGNDELLQVDSEMTLQRWNYSEFRCEETATSAKCPEEIKIHAEHLNEQKKYLLGFSWWNGYQHGSHEDNFQSVFIEFVEGGARRRIPLVLNHALPRFDGEKKKDVEQVELPLPKEVTGMKSFEIIITKGAGPEKDRNVYLSEVWLRDGSFLPLYSTVLTEAKDCVKPRVSYASNLFASDPVGKKVDPGKEYRPLDCFYVDVVSEDPFAALELYGQSVSAAQGVHLPIYDFPTVCLWYAESAEYGNSGAENSTVGAVREMQHIRASGFLNYSRAAVRLVPDSYMPDNQQGWWDDEHWQHSIEEHVGGKHGRYLPPYETTEKWAKAVTDLGGIPLTYFQSGYRSEDYAKAFPGHMLFNQTYAWRNGPVDTKGEIFTSWKQTWIRNGKVVRGYDYTDPDFLRHLEKVYQNLKRGGVRGLMFDYPFSGWADQGGLEDPYSTTAAAYRNIFRYASEGLGPGAFVHERNMEQGSDVTIGVVASMRTENDTDEMDSVTVTRCGLRWYKNRVLMNQDTDSKNILRLQGNRDVVRSVLTMCYVVSGRFLLANSFRQFSTEMLWDLSRTFPYHTENKTARPVDAFVSTIPMVYDFEVNDKWHQVTFYNPEQEKEKKIGISISGDRVNGSLALDKQRSYYVHDFWNDNFIGELKGTARLEQVLRPGESRMMSVREMLDIPQVLSTDRHIMQGYLDLSKTEWNAATKTLKATSKIVGNDPYTITIASNGYQGLHCFCNDQTALLTLTNDTNGLLRLKIECASNKEVEWTVAFK